MTSKDSKAARVYADDAILLDGGRIVARGSADEAAAAFEELDPVFTQRAQERAALVEAKQSRRPERELTKATPGSEAEGDLHAQKRERVAEKASGRKAAVAAAKAATVAARDEAASHKRARKRKLRARAVPGEGKKGRIAAKKRPRP